MMIILSKTPQQDKLHRYNSLLDVLDQAKHMARNNAANQRVMDAIENTTAIVYYEMKKVEAAINLGTDANVD